MDIVMLAPFALEPKGTVRARMVPIANELEQRGHSAEIIVAPWDNPEYSGKTVEFEGITVSHVTIDDDNLTENIKGMLRMIYAAARRDPDVYHAFKPKGHSGFAALYLLSRSSIPVIIDTDDWEGHGGHNKRSQRSWFEKEIFHYQEQLIPRYADAVTVASRTLQTQVWSNRASQDGVFYVPNGQYPDQIDIGSANPDRVREELDVGDAPLVLLYTRFFEYDLERVIDIFTGIKDSLPNVEFLTIGTGKYGEDEEFADLIADAGLQDDTHLLGWVDFENLPDYFIAADVGVFPLDDSLITRSKCPAKLTELMLSELPVVAESVGQVKEYITHNESGILCQPGDVERFVDETVELLDSTAYRDEMGRNARHRILSEFNWERIVDNVENAYEYSVSRA